MSTLENKSAGDIKAIVTIAGFDPTGGAGLLSDLKVFTSYNLYGMAVMTALTIQDSNRVLLAEPIPAKTVLGQLTALEKDFKIEGYKLGMLGSDETALALSKHLKNPGTTPLLVIDPVLKATSGYDLFPPGAIGIYRSSLFPLATAITPNVSEAEALLQTSINTLDEAVKAAGRLAEDGPGIVVITGFNAGHKVSDIAFIHGEPFLMDNERMPFSVHGTGCIYSAALLASLASGMTGQEALISAHEHTRWRMKDSHQLGQGQRMPGI